MHCILKLAALNTEAFRTLLIFLLTHTAPTLDSNGAVSFSIACLDKFLQKIVASVSSVLTHTVLLPTFLIQYSFKTKDILM